MKKVNWQNAVFLKTAVGVDGFPKGNLPEIAVVGRSNVGKSSLLNYLFQKKRLVKTSSVPGKTQAINFFLVDEKVIFVDLPGYGFAKVPKEVRCEWGPLIESYFQNRSTLRLTLLLLDIRRMPSEEDLQLISFLKHHSHPFTIVLTKADKVSSTDRQKRLKSLLDNSILCSVTENIGTKELYQVLEGCLR